MDAESPPLSPLLSHATRREAMNKQRQSLRSSTDVQSREIKVTSSRDLARLLVSGEREANELRKMVITVTEQLKAESQRADDNEKRAREALFRFKMVDEARIAALQDAAKATEELRLYKIQLEYAQKEINRAQEVLDSIEQQRYDAEESAARARSTARRINEERLIDLAREEGRRIGLQEGLRRGQELGFVTGRNAGFEQARSDSGRPVYADEEVEEESPYDPPMEHQDPGLTPIEEDMINFPPPTPPQRTTPPGPPPPPPHDSPPARSSSSHRSSRTPTIIIDQPSRQPTPVHNVMSPLRHPTNVIPPDVWIPRMDDDSRIRLPPPHEMQVVPPSPEPVYAPVMEEDTPLMVPPPVSRRSSTQFTPPVATQMSQPQHEHRSRHRHQYRPGRASSPESQGSTTISQFELVSEPYGPSATQRSRASHLSVIPEAASTNTTPAYGTRSIAGEGTSRTGSVTPGYQESLRGTPNSAPNHISIPVPHVAQSNIDNMTPNARDIYRRPTSVASSASSRKSGTPSRTPLGSQASLHRKSSSSVPDITIQPPSRPSSQTPSHTPIIHREFLNADDAARMPVPPAQPAPPSNPSLSYSTYSPAADPQPLPSDGQLPPNFVPLGGAVPPGPLPSQPSPKSNSPNLPGMSPIYQPAPSENSWGTPQVPVAFPTIPVPLAHPTAPVIPGQDVDFAGENPRSRKKNSRLNSESSAPSMPSTTRSSVVVPPPSLFQRPIEPSSSDSEDIPVPSELSSSVDTLTTPPPSNRGHGRAVSSSSKARSKKSSSSKGARTPKRNTYEVADLPEGVQYPSSPLAGMSGMPPTPGTTTSVAAARVPLPSPSTASGRSARSHATSNTTRNAGMTPGMRSSSLRNGDSQR